MRVFCYLAGVDDEWAIEITPGGMFDVTVNGRAVFYDATTLDEAVEMVRLEGGEEYTFIEEDGYRTQERV